MLSIEQINELRENHKNTIEKKASYGISTEGDMAIMLLWDIYEMRLTFIDAKSNDCDDSGSEGKECGSPCNPK